MASLWQNLPTLRDDGRYQDGGYWGTPLGWYMATIMLADPNAAARVFCEAVEDYQESGDVNEWITDYGRGARDYKASATMPLAGLRRLRSHLAEKCLRLSPDLAQRVDACAGWLETEADRIVRGCARTADDGTTIFTPDMGGHYGAFWVRDWSYAIEGKVEAFSVEELERGYLFLVAAQRADGCMPDRVRLDGQGIYSPGAESAPFSLDGSTDQSPFMVIVCEQVCQRLGSLELFERTYDRLAQGMAFVPRNPENGLVSIADANQFRPYSFLDSVPLLGDEHFSSVLYWDAANKLSKMSAAVGRRGRALAWREEAHCIASALDDLYDEALGCYVGASVHWPQPSVWGSAFSVYVGLTDEARSTEIAQFCLDNQELIVKRGQIRHLLKGTFWGRPMPEYVA